MPKLPIILTRALLLTVFLGFHFVAFAQVPSASKEKLAQWEPVIKAFEASDKTNPPPQNAIVFIGSSSIRIWRTLEKDFAGQKVINRGFGGSQIEDSVRYVQRIVLPYKPRAVVFYAGDNDLFAGKTPQQIFNDFKRFVYKVHWALPETKIFFISIKPSPARWKFRDNVVGSNHLIKTYCQKEKELTFIDVYSAMLDKDGQPRGDLFQKDGLHLNGNGYALWAKLIGPYLQAE